MCKMLQAQASCAVKAAASRPDNAPFMKSMTGCATISASKRFCSASSRPFAASCPPSAAAALPSDGPASPPLIARTETDALLSPCTL